MRANPQESADLVTFTEEIRNGKLHFLCSDISKKLPLNIIIQVQVQVINKENPECRKLPSSSY